MTATAGLGPALLFCPGDRPDRFSKALDRADTVILDLEDAVAPHRKDLARRLAVEAAALIGDRAVVRLNTSDSGWFPDDLAAVRAAGVRRVMLPRAVDPAVLRRLSDLEVIGLCETAAGVLGAAALAQEPNCSALMWGGEDLVADLGGRSSRGPDGRYYPVVEQLRSSVLLAAAAAGKVAIDAVHVDIRDLDGLRRETREAVDMGFDAKACIHPDHVAVIRDGYRPATDQVDWAEGVLAHPGASEGGVFRVGDEMIDGPLLHHARNILARSERVTVATR